MKTPIVKYSDRFLDSVSWFFKVGGITLWPFIILREKYNSTDYWRRVARKTINHESIHIKQQAELLVLPFYLIYIIEWFIKSILYFSPTKGYYNISFEREAYANETDWEYLGNRRKYAWIKRIFK